MASLPNIPFETNRFDLQGHFKVGVEMIALFPNAKVGFFSNTELLKHKNENVNSPAYGYMYLENAYANERRIMDFNKEKAFFYIKLVIIGVSGYFI